MDLVVAGTDDAVMMVESEIQELTEDEVLGGVMFAHERHAAGDRRDHRTGRARRQGALRLPAGRHRRRQGRGQEAWSARTCAPPTRSPPRASATTPSPRPRPRPPTQFGKSDANPDGYRPDKLGARLQGTAKPTSCAATSSTPASASTAARSTRSARSSRKSACCRAPTARPCSPAARPRPWSSPPWAPATTSS